MARRRIGAAPAALAHRRHIAAGDFHAAARLAVARAGISVMQEWGWTLDDLSPDEEEAPVLPNGARIIPMGMSRRICLSSRQRVNALGR